MSGSQRVDVAPEIKKDEPSRFIQTTLKVINSIEVIGNKLPHPVWIFVFLSAFVIALSAFMNARGVSVINPSNGEINEVKSLLSREGMQVMLGDIVENYATFPPLATILITMLGIAVAEASGLIDAVLRGTVSRVKPRYITFAVSYAGMIGHVAGDAAYVTLIPLGALTFRAVGRSPVLGAIVAFVSISAGYDASPVLTTTDVLLSGISTAAAHTIDPEAFISPTSNYFFGLVSSIVISLTITFVVEKVLAKRDDLEVDEDAPEDSDEIKMGVDENEVRGMKAAGIASIIFFALLAAALIPAGSPFRGEGDSILKSPVMTGMAGVIGLYFTIAGYVYGKRAGTFEKPTDIIPAMAKGLSSMGPILVLFFFVSQFLAYFKWTGISAVLAVNGAELLESWAIPSWAMLLGLAVLLSFMNLIITSGSAMWALVAPVFIPMLMLLGIAPEETQALYRVADSVTNCITPMSPYFVMALGFVQKYRKSAGIGTLASFTIPIAMTVWVVWMTLFTIWFVLGLPFGF